MMSSGGSGVAPGQSLFWPSSLVARLWARQDLNLQPTDYESAALTGLSYGPDYSEGTGHGHLYGSSDGVRIYSQLGVEHPRSGLVDVTAWPFRASRAHAV